MGFFQDINIQLLQALQSLSPVLDSLSRFFTFLGTPGFYVLLLPLIYWLVDKRLGKTAFLALILSVFLSLSIKQLLHLPRPYWLGEIQGLTTDATYGTPSTHASSSLAVLGYLAYRLNQSWLWAASCLCVLLIGISSLYLGMQFPLGILSGWLFGLVIVLVICGWDKTAAHSRAKPHRAVHIILAIMGSLWMVGTGHMIHSLIKPSPDPSAWKGFATNARSLVGYYLSAGGLVGLVLGDVLTRSHQAVQIVETVAKKAAACLVGLAGLIVLYYGLGYVIDLFILQGTITEFLIRFLQAGLLGLWITFGAPWIFVIFQLAKPQLTSKIYREEGYTPS